MTLSHSALLYSPKYALTTPSSALPIALNEIFSQLDYMLQCKLWRQSQEFSTYTSKYTMKKQDTSNLTWLSALKYAPECSIQRFAKM